MDSKKRLLVTISFSFSIRYLYRTGLLHKLREFSEPVIAITWNEQDLVQEMQADGFEVHVIPASSKDALYANVRTKIDYWFDAFALKSSSKKMQKKYLAQYVSQKDRLKRKVRTNYNYMKFLLPGYKEKLFQRERSLLKAHTNYLQMSQLVDRLNIDAVFSVTPFNTQEDIFLRACKDKGKKMITSILSFDNITKRGWIPVPYDHYMVWNKYNYQEALSVYPAAAKPVNTKVVGAAQFDFYFNDKYLLPKAEWQKQKGLPAGDRKIILYAGGPKSLFPNEPQYLKHILEAIDEDKIKGNPIVLFRCHPVDVIERWKNYTGSHPNLYLEDSWTGKENLQLANISNETITSLCSTLAYTDVHINLCSTMTVDGCAFRKPQIGPAYDDVNPTKAHLLRGMYQQDHFKPILKTNGLRLATSKEEMISSINEALQKPENFTLKCKDILEEIITYTDGRSTDRVVQAIKEVL
jgi:hypothetical protein